ncbi:MAG TPA: S41 family peptidase [Rhodothermales bacterium]|nr:S41 family peptidase [Rhodothermales bacterium]
MKSTLRLVVLSVVLIMAGLALGVGIAQKRSDNPDTLRQLRKLEDAFMLITQQYVEPVNTEKLVEGAIQGMLEELDPHSAYIAARELREVQESFEGTFGGVGIYFEIVRDTARVINTVPNGPSEKVGLMPGDRLLMINDSTAIGFDDEDVRRNLKGEVGTTVRVMIQRAGLSQPRQFTITRARIPILTVESSFMADTHTGYMRIGHFAQTTYDEFRQHLTRLQQQGADRLILDLRDNPGGIMSSAVKIADEFLKTGQTIVSTRSRNARFNESEAATAGGRFEQQPLIVLLNENSASASEIVAGALQDHDRALIVGRRSFGKGLVQTQFPLTDGSVLQMTISRYYTPSGRLIQTPYEHGESVEHYLEQKYATRAAEVFNPQVYVNQVPDSLKFRTSGGRIVFGGGGILPDIVVAPDTSSLYTGVARTGVDFRFAQDYFERHEQTLRRTWGTDPARFRQQYEVSDAVWQEFIAFMQRGEDAITLTDNAAQVSPRQRIYLRADLARQREDIEARVKAYLARNLYGAEQWYPIAIPTDQTFREAMRLWDRAASLLAQVRH